MDLRDLFEGLDAGSSIALAEEIGDGLAANDTAIRVLDEFDAIIADKLLAAALTRDDSRRRRSIPSTSHPSGPRPLPGTTPGSRSA